MDEATGAEAGKLDKVSGFHHAKYVWMDDGETEDIYAQIIRDLGGGSLNLYCVPESGEPFVANGIARREKADVVDGDAGRTWHSVRFDSQ